MSVALCCSSASSIYSDKDGPSRTARRAKAFEPRLLQADREEAEELKSQLASGLCSLAEMYMASEESDMQAAVHMCEPLLQQAREADAHSPEPLQVTSRPQHSKDKISVPSEDPRSCGRVFLCQCMFSSYDQGMLLWI